MPPPDAPAAGSATARADELLVARGLAPSRAQARALIEAGQVSAGPDGKPVAKPGARLPADADLTVAAGAGPRFVSRGGDKLEAFLERFPVALQGRHVLDVGASTGGFTDCALQRGAASVTAIDVGHGQLHPRLAGDARVTSFEGVNARHLAPGDLPRPAYDAVVLDLSFISLRTVLPAVWPFLAPGGTLVALVKPQFEAGKAEADRGRGVIRDPRVRQAALDGVVAFALEALPGARLAGAMPSPLAGGDGNREFLVGLEKAAD